MTPNGVDFSFLNEATLDQLRMLMHLFLKKVGSTSTALAYVVYLTQGVLRT